MLALELRAARALDEELVDTHRDLLLCLLDLLS